MTHPQIIHFPIALLSLAVITELISYFWQKGFFRKMTLTLLVVGVLAAFLAVQTGESAVESLGNIAPIKQLISQHQEAGEKVLKIFGLVLLLKLTLLYLKKEILSLRIMITLLMLAGFFELYQAGHFGGILVYEKGVGIEQLFDDPTVP